MLDFVSAEYQLANIFTKPLHEDKLYKIRFLGVVSSSYLFNLTYA